MAAGIFSIGALPRLPLGAALTFPADIAVGLIWLATAAALAGSAWRRGGIANRTESVIESFGIGTWVAGTAVLARILMLAAPEDPWPARIAFLLSIGLWLWFVPRAVANLVRLARSRRRPNGIVLLSTVATQAIALIALRLFPASPAVRWAVAALMALGAGFYALAAFLVVRGHIAGGWRLATDWANGNCILHGALSITGLTMIASGRFGEAAILVYWEAVIAVFVAVEAIEIARLAARVREQGWRRAILVYDVSQWARNFTFGMFYAFTLAFRQVYPGPDPLRDAIVACGSYVVLALLVAEAGLLVATAARRGAAAAPMAAPPPPGERGARSRDAAPAARGSAGRARPARPRSPPETG